MYINNGIHEDPGVLYTCTAYSLESVGVFSCISCGMFPSLSHLPSSPSESGFTILNDQGSVLPQQHFHGR